MVKHSGTDKIRAELAWITETPDPTKCGCRNLRCCDETGHKLGACAAVVATKFWTFRWEYYCARCRKYGWCGSKIRGYPDFRFLIRRSDIMELFWPSSFFPGIKSATPARVSRRRGATHHKYGSRFNPCMFPRRMPSDTTFPPVTSITLRVTGDFCSNRSLLWTWRSLSARGRIHRTR